jgi:hypothetical protein
MAAKEEQFLLWYKDIGRKLADKYPTCTVACEAFKAAMDIMEAAATSHNKQIMPVCPCYKVEYSVNEESVGEFGIGICTCDGKPA